MMKRRSQDPGRGRGLRDKPARRRARTSASRVKVRRPGDAALLLLRFPLLALDADQGAEQNCGGEIERDVEQLLIFHRLRSASLARRATASPTRHLMRKSQRGFPLRSRLTLIQLPLSLCLATLRGSFHAPGFRFCARGLRFAAALGPRRRWRIGRNRLRQRSMESSPAGAIPARQSSLERTPARRSPDQIRIVHPNVSTGGQDAIPPGRGGWNTEQGTAGEPRCGRLPTRHGRHAAQLPVPEELGIARRQLRALHRLGVQQRARLGRHAASLPRRRGEAVLHHAPGRLEGLLLRDLRQVLGGASRQRRCGPSGWPWLNSMM